MPNPKVKILRSSVSGKRPGVDNIELGELALNTNDGQLFAKRDTGGVGIATTVTLLTPWTENYEGGTIEYSGNATVTGILSATTIQGNASTLSGIVTQITAGPNISIDQATGNVTITGLANTTNIIADTLVVSGIATVGVLSARDGVVSGTLTATNFVGNGSGLYGITTAFGQLSDVTFTNLGQHDIAVYHDGEGWLNDPGASRVVQEIRNITGFALTEGYPVFEVGYNQGNERIEVAGANADSSATMPALGIIHDAELGNNSNGYVIISGVADNINTSDYSVGDELYVAVGGGLTNIRPTHAFALIQKIGTVLRSSATTGSILVKGAGRSNDVPNTISVSSSITAADGLYSDTLTITGDASVGDSLTVTNDASVGGAITVTGQTNVGVLSARDAVLTGVVTATTFDGNVTGNITGNADTATALATPRTIALTGDVVATATPFDGTSNISIAATIQPNSVALGDDTTGNYVATIAGTANEITVTGSGSETAAITLSLPDDITVGDSLTITNDATVGGALTVGGASGISITTDTITGPAELIIDPAAVGDNTGIVRIKGDLRVDGEEFIVSSKTIELADQVVGIATTVATNSLLDGAGISIGATAIQKTFTFNNSTNSLESSIGLAVTSGGSFKAGSNTVLTSTTLGAGVVNSSLTSVGTLGSVTISGGVSIGDSIFHTGDTNTAIRFPAADTFTVETAGSERIRIDSSGRLLVGTSSARTDLIGGTRGPRVQIEEANSNVITALDNSSLSLTMGSSSELGSANIFFTRTKSNSFGGKTSVADNNILGGIYFQGTDGTDAVSAALIKAEVDGTPGSNDMPGRIILATTADGASLPTERMRVTSSGNVGIGTNDPGYKLDVAGNAQIGNTTGAAFLEIGQGATESRNAYIDFIGDTTYTDYGFRVIRAGGGANTASSLVHRGTGALNIQTVEAGSINFLTSSTERMRIESSGYVGIGTNPSYLLDVNTNYVRFGNTSGVGIMQLGASSTASTNFHLGATGSTVRLWNGDIGTGTEIMRVTSSGNVGINTSAPSSLLHASIDSSASVFRIERTDAPASIESAFGGGDSALKYVANNASSWVQGIDDSDSDKFKISYGSADNAAFGTNDFLTATTAGKFGINWSTPGSFLTVATDTAPDSADVGGNAKGSIFLINSGGTPAQYALGNAIGFSRINTSRRGAMIASYQPTTDGDQCGLSFYTRSATNTASDAVVQRMVLNHVGNLGIGETNPIYQLHLGDAGAEQITAKLTDGSDLTLFWPTGSASNSAGSEVSRFGIYYETNDWNSYLQFIRGTGATTGEIAFVTSQSEALRIADNGNVGIGTNDPARLLHLAGSGGANSVELRLNATDGGERQITFTGSGSGTKVIRSTGTTDNSLVFLSGSTENMRIDSSGSITLSSTNGTTATHSTLSRVVQIGNAASVDAALNIGGGFTGDASLNIRDLSGIAASFYFGATKVGSITLTASATAYNTSSDYRLKENVVDVSDGIIRVKQLKPSRFNFIAEPGQTVDGFLAHEVQAVVPEAITGEKDAVDDDGNPVYQGIDQSKLVPLLTAALQEALTKIENLEQRLNDAGL